MAVLVPFFIPCLTLCSRGPILILFEGGFIDRGTFMMARPSSWPYSPRWLDSAEVEHLKFFLSLGRWALCLWYGEAGTGPHTYPPCHGTRCHHVPGSSGEPAVRQILDVLWNFLERDESRASSILISFLVEEMLSWEDSSSPLVVLVLSSNSYVEASEGSSTSYLRGLLRWCNVKWG